MTGVVVTIGAIAAIAVTVFVSLILATLPKGGNR